MLPRSIGHGAPVDLAQHKRANAEALTLRPVQEQALAQIAAHKGLVGGIGVGHGKSLIALLSGLVLKVDLAIVLVAPATVANMLSLLADLESRYHMPPTLVVSWGKLSQADAGEWLQSLDVAGKRVVLVADEAHCARNPTAARTKRLMAWLDQHSHVWFVALSGTLTTRRVKDFAHLAKRALGANCPIPRDASDLRAWDEVLANEARAPADFASVIPLWDWAQCTGTRKFPKTGLRLSPEDHALLVEAFGERLSSCPGVVLTRDASCAASLYVVRVYSGRPEIDKLRKWAQEIARFYRDPDGVDLVDDAEVAKTAKRLSFGYYYTWVWPHGVADREWMEKRSQWGRTCRNILANHATWGFDSPALVESEARKILKGGRGVPRWVQDFADWDEVSIRVAPATACKWVCDVPLQTIVRVATENAPAIIWYDEDAVADKLQSMGVEVLRAGQPVTGAARTLALSVRSHGAGLNLQAWSRQVFACVPSNGTSWEQVLGRTHRQGQQEDEVWAWVPMWTNPLRESLSQARKDAEWIARSTGNAQKLLLATYVET